MMRWLVGSSLRFRFIVIAFAAVMILYGIDRLNHMPVDVFPEFAPPIVEIQTPSLGLSPEEVEELVTIPLEEALNGLPGLDVIRSKAVPQLSAVKLYFKRGTDLMYARQVVQERLDTVAGSGLIPADVGPPVMLPPLSATSRFLKIGITSDTLSVIDLSMITYWKIRARLMGVPGVANVAIWGERLDMLQVQVEPEKLRDLGITLDEVKEVTANALEAGLLKYSEGAIVGTGGFIDTPNQRLGIQHVLPIKTVEDLAKVSIEAGDGTPMTLGEVANVVKDHQPLVGDGVIDEDIGLLLIVEKFPWANTLQVTRGVEEALEALRPGLPEVIMDAEIFRPATFIEMSIENLTRALLIASILVILILIAFLYEWRIALISCIAIPLSLMSAVLVLYFQGTTINTMVLAGLVIALGAVVDDAIIDVENIVRRLRQHRKEGKEAKSTARIILEASIEVRNAIVFATLIEVMALVPVFFMEGLSGAFFKPLAFSYALAILASMIVALTVTPALSLILLRRAPLERRQSPLIKLLHGRYDRFLKQIVQKPSRAYLTVIVLVIAGVAIWPRLGQQLLPSFQERDFLMHWLARPGTSLPEMDRITIQASKELQDIEGVRNFGAHIGQALIMDEVVGIYFGENWISVDPSVPYQKTVDKIQETVDGYPGLFRDVLTYLKERIREVLTGSSDAIVLRIYGPELHNLRALASEVRESLEDIEGIIDLHVELQNEIPQIEIEVDLAEADVYGLKPGDVRRAAATLINGIEVGDIFRDGRAYDVQVWSTPETRDSLNDVQELLIDTPSGDVVQLQEVADVRIAPVPNHIDHEGMARKIDVSANVDFRKRDLGSVVGDVKVALAGIDFPLGYRIEMLGEYTERQAAQQKLFIYAIFAVFVIFLLLQASFNSWRLAVIAFLTLPMAFVGGILATLAGGGVVSLGSLVGFLTVLGIAARNGIMMINHFQHLEQHEGETFGPELVLRGARERLAPILMTATTTGLALLPLVISGNLPGHEIEYPMAIVIVGGLITSTLLNLFVIPSLYLRFGNVARGRQQLPSS